MTKESSRQRSRCYSEDLSRDDTFFRGLARVWCIVINTTNQKKATSLEAIMNQIGLYIASTMTGLWGIAHLFATRGVVAGFGDITTDNRRIITMEWIVEGVALISTAAFVAAATAIQPDADVSLAVFAVAIGTLVALAVVSLFTGFKVAFLPFRLCPLILGAAAALIAWGGWF